DRLSRVENSLFSRMIRAASLVALYCKRKFGQWLLHSPFHALYLAFRRAKPAGSAYTSWIESRETAFPSRESHRQQAETWTRKPLISILMPTRNPRRDWLEAAIDSVASQSYEKWQLCVCDDASDEPWVLEYLQARAAADARILF